MNLEVPNDWGVTRRQNHQTAAKEPQEETVVKGRKHEALPPDDCPAKKKKKNPEVKKSQEPLSSQDSPFATADKESGGEEQKKREEAIVTKSPLGPRGLFNAISHDAPEKGQLKQIVMMHLISNKSSGATASSSHDISVESEGAMTQDSMQMEVHCLLSKLPYQKMLSDLFSVNDKDLMPNPNIPFVSRVYEESFMREPLNSTERLCAKGDQCECMFIDPENSFVCIEFLLPGERQPPSPHLCVVCCRAVTQQLYYDIMFDKHDFGGVIQRFGNIHSQPGEYALDAMLIAAPSVPLHIMPLPIVSHQRNRYSVYNKHGIKHMKQTRVYFQNTPSC